MPLPAFVVIAGPNGSGKSSMTQVLRELGYDLPAVVDADRLARGLEGAPEDRARQAQDQVQRARDEAIRDRRSFAYETVLSHPSHVGAMINASQAGFFVRLIFVGTEDPSINVARVADRVAKGGHDVPPEKIVGRWHRTMEITLPQAIQAAQESLVFDNSAAGGGAVPVAHVMGAYVRHWPRPHLTWPERCILDPLKRLDYYEFTLG